MLFKDESYEFRNIRYSGTLHTAAFILPAFILAVIVNLPKVTSPILLENLKYLAVLVMNLK